MPIDPTDILGQLERAIGLMPAAFLVIVMLAGPTVAWLLYRFVVQPRTRRYADTSLDVFWICEQCRSANDVHVSQCYSCGLERDVTMAGGVRVLDAGGALLLAPEVGEGTQPGAVPTPAMAQAPAAAAQGQAAAPAAQGPAASVPAAPAAVSAAPAAAPANAEHVPASPPTAKPRRLVAVGPGSARPVAASRTVAASPVVPATPAASAPPGAKKSRRTPVPVMDPETVSAPAVVATPSATSRKRTPKVPTATPPGAEPGA